MKNFYRICAQLMTISLILFGCQNQAPPPQAAVVEPTAPTTQAEPTTPPPTVVPTATLAPTETPAPLPTASPTLVVASESGEEPAAAIPASSLFETAWTDRTLFKEGLIASEQAILDKLPGASVYHIEIAFASDMQQLQGIEEVLYTNQEEVPLTEIYFRLFPNLAGGSTTIETITVNDVPIEPAYELRDSALRLDLAQPLPPNEQIVIRLEFAVEIPDTDGGNYGTFAYQDEILAMAHFYPMIAVYDDEGWNVEIAPPMGDVIYADSSFYLVRITAPAEQVIVTSGVEREQSLTDDEQTLTIAAGPMRDFYLAASHRFEVISETVAGTVVNSYAPPELAEGNETTLQFAVDSIESFNEHFGTYPYTEFDLLPINTGALGIEYPGITAILINLYDSQARIANLPSNVLLEATVAHEVAHQWFYGLVGNDQVDEPWLDEALAQYATYLYYIDNYGVTGAQGFYQSLEDRWDRVDRADIPIGLPVGDYSPQEYGAIVYGRGPLFVETLAETMGEEEFAQFISDYYKTFQWGIATSQEFQSLAEQHCDCDLSDLFAEWVYAKP